MFYFRYLYIGVDVYYVVFNLYIIYGYYNFNMEKFNIIYFIKNFRNKKLYDYISICK